MQVTEIRRLLDNLVEALPLLTSWGLRDAAKAHQNLVRIAEAGVTLDLMSDICGQLGRRLPRLSDADMAVNNLERFFCAARNPPSTRLAN